ncbi:maestro heat-like repeat-containing protein family member 7 [Heliangelus exortis]|uniref:maestro heat-like repeat-containing protein family member 7 n=2 Tax=Heliangelus exortis TaxID=472823 RepID=UPI003A8E2749
MSLIYKLSLAAVMLEQEQPDSDQPVPLGLAVEGIKVLLHAAGCQGHIENIQKEGGWDMMLQAETLERGISAPEAVPLAQAAAAGWDDSPWSWDRGLCCQSGPGASIQPFLLGQCSAPLRVHRQGCPPEGLCQPPGPELAVVARSCRVPGSCSSARLSPLLFFQLLGCQGLGKDPSDVRLLCSYLSHGRQTVRLRALGGLVALAGDPRMAREMRGSSLLESILTCLKDPSTDVRMKALLFFRTMMGQLKRKEASPIALLLVEKLPALFGDESSQVQELSLRLFEDTLKAAVRRDKAEMKDATRRVALSLFLHMNAESRSMAEASGKGLLICAKFLGWRKLKRVIKKKRTWLIGETLLKQERSRVEDYLYFSLPYLWDSQTSVRLEAIRFMGTAAQHLGRNPSQRTMEVVWDALKRCDDDLDASVRSLAGQTLRILQTVRELERSRRSFRGLCFSC